MCSTTSNFIHTHKRKYKPTQHQQNVKLKFNIKKQVVTVLLHKKKEKTMLGKYCEKEISPEIQISHYEDSKEKHVSTVPLPYKSY